MRRFGLNDGWEVRRKVHRLAELAGESAPWEPVTLPHDALIGATRSPDAGPATGYHPGGEWEYRRRLDLDEREPGAPVVLELEGAYRSAVVRVNGSVAGRWPNGYAEVRVPIDHLLGADGGDLVEVDVTTGDDSRWYAGAGLYRPVWLLTAGPLHLGAASLAVIATEVDDEVATVTVAVDVVNQTGATVEASAHTTLSGSDGTVVAEERSPVTVFPGDTVRIHQRLHVVEPRRWAPADPHLHTATVRLVGADGAAVDEETTTFGIRSLTLDPRRGLRIKGETVKLRGACVHHDNGPLGAATFERAEERRVELLVEAGFNALRSAHQPMSRAMLDACDRLGVLVMDELTDMWCTPKTGNGDGRGAPCRVDRANGSQPLVIRVGYLPPAQSNS